MPYHYYEDFTPCCKDECDIDIYRAFPYFIDYKSNVLTPGGTESIR